ncbi:MAG: hypothetical protein WCH98_08910 [Verrucomicrobiota bacterium]
MDPFTKRYRAGFAEPSVELVWRALPRRKSGTSAMCPYQRRKSGTFCASLRYQLMRAVPGVFPCGVNLRLISRAAILTARVPSRPNILLTHYLTKRYRAGFGDAPVEWALSRRKSGTPAVRPYRGCRRWGVVLPGGDGSPYK